MTVKLKSNRVVKKESRENSYDIQSKAGGYPSVCMQKKKGVQKSRRSAAEELRAHPVACIQDGRNEKEDRKDSRCPCQEITTQRGFVM